MASQQRPARATAWSAVDVLARQGVQFGVTLLLARLLTPAEFGAVVLMSLFTGVALTIAEAGVTTSLVQRPTLTDDDTTTAWWLTTVVAVAMAATLVLCGPLIANFYDSPPLSTLAAVMAVNVVFASMGFVPTALLQRNLDFRLIAVCGAVASAASGAAAIILAYQGAGIWALAAQLLVMSGVNTVMVWILSGWRPRGATTRAIAASLLRSGRFVMPANLLDIVFVRSYTVLIGRSYGVSDVGFYSRADQTQQLPVQMLSIVFGRVALPLFSRASADREVLLASAQKAMRCLMWCNVPLMLALAVMSQPVITMLYGKQWEPAAPLFGILCLAGVLWPLHVINLQVLIALGELRLFFRLEVAKKLVGVTLIVAGAQFGLEGLAWSQVVFGVLAFVANAHYTRLFLQYGALRQLSDISASLGLSVVVASVAALVTKAWDGGPVLELVVVMVGGGIVYVALSYLLRLPAWSDVASVVRSTIRKEATVSVDRDQ